MSERMELPVLSPMADVRIVISEVYKLESGLAKMGLVAPALTEAREILLRMSVVIANAIKEVHP